VVQPGDDVVAIPENAVKVVEMLGNRASMVTIKDAGHALLPEQPAAVAAEILIWLEQRHRVVRSPVSRQN
jgi:pimeloyl-ACP methyl ester carboxylesterase